MNIFIMLGILLANTIAIVLVYQFVKRLPKKEKIIFIGISFAIIYVAVSIVYWISGFGIDSRINEAAKDFVTFLFVPINVIILVPFVAAKYSKLKQAEIDASEFKKRIVIISIIGVIILIGECFYFKNMKNNIKMLNESIEQKNKQEQIDTNIEKENNIIKNTNEIIVNQIQENNTNSNNKTTKNNEEVTNSNNQTTKNNKEITNQVNNYNMISNRLD